MEKRALSGMQRRTNHKAVNKLELFSRSWWRATKRDWTVAYVTTVLNYCTLKLCWQTVCKEFGKKKCSSDLVKSSFLMLSPTVKCAICNYLEPDTEQQIWTMANSNCLVTLTDASSILIWEAVYCILKLVGKLVYLSQKQFPFTD